MPRTLSPSPRLAARFDRLLDRLALRLSDSRRIDGMWVGCFGVEKSGDALGRVEEALRLIKTHDSLRYDRLLRDVDRIWVNLLFGSNAAYRHPLRLCVLDERFVLGDTTRPEQIASVIVHEAAHARLMRCGIGYQAELRARVEAVCFRRQRAFAAKLPDGEETRVDAESRLAGYPADFWTDDAFRARFEQGGAEALRFDGTPDFLIRAVLRFRGLLARIHRLIQRLKRLFRA
jgi:hypothetical protein